MRSSSEWPGSCSSIEIGRVVHLDIDVKRVAELVMVGDHRDRALLRLQHLEPHLGDIGQQRAAPAPRAKGGDRRQRHQRRVERQDRAIGGEIIGGGAGRRRHQHAVGDELGHALLAVDQNADLGDLRALPQQRHFVDGVRGEFVAMSVGGAQQQRMHDRRLGAGACACAGWPRDIRSSESRPSPGSCRRSACRRP